MLTGLQFAFLASALIWRSLEQSTATRIRPEGFVNVSSFGTPAIAGVGSETVLTPEGFTNASSFGTPILIATPPLDETLLRPEGFTNVSSFGTPLNRYEDDFSLVSFFAHFTGADEQTTQSDLSDYGKTITMSGGAKIDDGVLHPDDGQPTALKDATNDVVTVPHDANWWGTNESLCMEIEVYWPALPSTGLRFIMGKYRSVTNGRGLAIYLTTDANTIHAGSEWKLAVFRQDTSTAGTAFLSALFEPTPGQFYHLALSRDKATDFWRLFIDGVMVHKVTYSPAITQPSQSFSIGAQNDASTHQHAFRWREARVWKGTPHYNSDAGFTPPAAPYRES